MYRKKTKRKSIYRVHFKEIGSDFYFSSIAEIYNKFEASQLKVSKNSLYHIRLRRKNKYENSKIKITREILYSRVDS